MSLPTLGETYSLLADVRSTEIKRQREEERQYRKDLRRDQLKATIGASLVGAIVNPLAKQVTAGISGVIQDKFGGRLENFKQVEQNYQQFVRDTKEANKFVKDFSEKHSAGIAQANSVRDYITNSYLPSVIENQVDREALKTYGPGSTLTNIWSGDDIAKNEYLRAISEKLFDEKDIANLETIFDSLQEAKLTSPEQSVAFARLDKKLKKAIGRDGPIPALLRKLRGVDLEATRKLGNEVLKNSEYNQSRQDILNLRKQKKEIINFELQEIASIFNDTVAERQRAILPDITNVETETVVDPNDGLLKEKVTTRTKLARPLFDPETKTFSDEKINIDTTEVVTKESLAKKALNNYSKLGTLHDLFKEFNEAGQIKVIEDFDKKFGKGSFEKMLAESEFGFAGFGPQIDPKTGNPITGDDGKPILVFTGKPSRTPRQIINAYELMFKAMRNSNITNDALDRQLIDLRFGEAITKFEEIAVNKALIISSQSLPASDPNKLTTDQLQDLEDRIKIQQEEVAQLLNISNGIYRQYINAAKSEP